MFKILWIITNEIPLETLSKQWGQIIETLFESPRVAQGVSFSDDYQALSPFDKKNLFEVRSAALAEQPDIYQGLLNALTTQDIYNKTFTIKMPQDKPTDSTAPIIPIIRVQIIQSDFLGLKNDPTKEFTAQDDFTLCVIDSQNHAKIQSILQRLPKSLRILILKKNNTDLYGFMKSLSFYFQPKYLNRDNQKFFDELLNLIRASHFLHVFPNIAAIQQYYKKKSGAFSVQGVLQKTFKEVLQSLIHTVQKDPHGASKKILQAMLNAMLFASTVDVTPAVSLLDQLESGDHTNTTGQTNMQTERHVTVSATAMGPTLLFEPFPEARPPNPAAGSEDWEFL